MAMLSAALVLGVVLAVRLFAVLVLGQKQQLELSCLRVAFRSPGALSPRQKSRRPVETPVQGRQVSRQGRFALSAVSCFVVTAPTRFNGFAVFTEPSPELGPISAPRLAGRASRLAYTLS